MTEENLNRLLGTFSSLLLHNSTHFYTLFIKFPVFIGSITDFLTSSLRHPKRQDGQTMASMTDVRVSAS